MLINKLIMYRDGSCNEIRVLHNLRLLVSEVIDFPYRCKNYDIDPELAEKLFFLIHKTNAEAVFSVDYYPIIAEVAHIIGIPYISWIIDSPHYTLYSPTSFYDEVYIFHFDYIEAQRLTDMGRPHVNHSTLSSDPLYFDKVIKNATDYSIKKYISNISFLGSSYQNEFDYFGKHENMSDFDSGFYDALIDVQLELYGVPLFESILTPQRTEQLMNSCDLRKPELYDIPKSLIAENALEKRVSVLERKKMIEMVAVKYGITIFSYEDSFPIKGVSYRGYADYETQMPLAFSETKINLNSTLRSIHSGIPLRSLDIMACGGFLLSNYQPELVENFSRGEDMEIYESIDELIEKSGWYLTHDKERKRIAENGKRKIYNGFTYNIVLSNILKLVK